VPGITTSQCTRVASSKAKIGPGKAPQELRRGWNYHAHNRVERGRQVNPTTMTRGGVLCEITQRDGSVINA
jgi:hypothetical protein